MPAVSIDGIRSMFAEQTADVWTVGITFAPPEGASGETFRMIANTEDVVYGGQIYRAAPFDFTLAQDNEDTVPKAQIRADNVSRDLIAAIRAANVNDAPVITVEIFRIGTGVVREFGPTVYSLLSVSADAFVIEGTLGYRVDFLNEPAVIHKFTPNLAPGLYA
jgi:hypothetical protein